VVLCNASQSPIRRMLGTTAKASSSLVRARTHKSRLVDVALLCPLCPGSHQIPHRSEMTRRAKRRHHYGLRGAISSTIRRSIRCGHERSKSNDDFGYSLTIFNGTTERPLDFFQIPRLSAQPA
jgi:hypothetical protein